MASTAPSRRRGVDRKRKPDLGGTGSTRGCSARILPTLASSQRTISERLSRNICSMARSGWDGDTGTATAPAIHDPKRAEAKEFTALVVIATLTWAESDARWPHCSRRAWRTCRAWVASSECSTTCESVTIAGRRAWRRLCRTTSINLWVADARPRIACLRAFVQTSEFSPRNERDVLCRPCPPRASRTILEIVEHVDRAPTGKKMNNEGLRPSYTFSVQQLQLQFTWGPPATST